MGYQLWTSPETGYRRHGTRLDDFNAVLGDRMRAKDICEPLKCCPADAPADEMKSALEGLDFDLAGVRETEQGSVIGFVRQTSLSGGDVRAHTESLASVTLIHPDTTIRDLLCALKAAPFVLIQSKGDVDAILTRADLNKPMIRVYLFGLISLLEIHMGFWIAHAYEGEQWQTELTMPRLDAATAIREQRASRGQNLPLLQCLQMCDKRTLIVQSDQLRGQLDLGSKKGSKKFFSDVEDLRNSIAHSQYDLISGGSWLDLILLIERIQVTVARSDRLVEDHAAERSANYVSVLW